MVYRTNLRMLSKMRRPSRTAWTMVAKLSSSSIMCAGLARHVGAALAHGDADVRHLQRRRVVDAVAGHGDELALVLQRLHDLDLLFRIDARVHPHRFHLALEFRQLSRASSLPVSTLPPSSMMPSRAGDGARGGGMVAGDHHRDDAGGLARGDRFGRLGARRIDEAREADEGQAAFQCSASSGVRHRRQPLQREGQHAQALRGQLFGCVLQRRLVDRRHGPRRSQLVDTQRQHALGRALHQHQHGLAVAMQRGHARPLGIEGKLGQARHGFAAIHACRIRRPARLRAARFRWGRR